MSSCPSQILSRAIQSTFCGVGIMTEGATLDSNLITARRIYFSSLILFGIYALWYGKVEQPQSYYQFADSREFIGIPNGLDVMSNLALLYPAILGLALLQERGKNDYQYRDDIEPIILYSFFSGMVLTFLGSVWFHLDPTDSTLMWDRLGMTIVLACYATLLISDFVSIEMAKKVHYPLIALGLLTIIYWLVAGDLRPYFIFKHQPIILIPILLVYGTKYYDRTKDYFWSFIFVILASTVESYDIEIFETIIFISGHTLKHIFAGTALWFVFKMIQQRQQIREN